MHVPILRYRTSRHYHLTGTSPYHNMSHIMRKPVYAIWELQRRRSAPPNACSLISAFVFHCLDSILLLVYISEISSLCLVPVTAQTGLSQPWSQDQDQDSLLVKCRNDSRSPGPVIRELVPSSHQRSELSNTILCIFSR